MALVLLLLLPLVSGTFGPGLAAWVLTCDTGFAQPATCMHIVCM